MFSNVICKNEVLVLLTNTKLQPQLVEEYGTSIYPVSFGMFILPLVTAVQCG